VYGDGVLVAALSFTEPAWKVACRDRILMKSQIANEAPRSATVNNARFLILPWVRIPNLASKILTLALTQMAHHWKEKFGVAPKVCETFVDPEKFHGTCYLAANWLFIGRTRGFAKRGSSHRPEDAPKLVLIRGLDSKSHRALVNASQEFQKRAA
jgi:hypothetical protein